MAEFECPVVKLTIKSHNNADNLSIAVIEGYECIVLKDEYQTGDRAVYIPEQAIVPDDLIENLGLTGRLAGPGHNRVKAIKLRGVLSQGLICPMRFVTGGHRLAVGDDCTEILEIKKHEPAIPAKLSGEVWHAGPERTIRYDIQNIKKYSRILEDEELVVFTEKLHGTWCMLSLLAPCLWDENEAPNGLVVSSKGRAEKEQGIRHPIKGRPLRAFEKFQLLYWKLIGKAISKFWGLSQLIRQKTWGLLRGLKMTATERIKELRKTENGVNVNNVYWRVAKHLRIQDKILFLPGALTYSYFVLGEVYGKGIQDLDYGADTGKNDTLGFRVFDIYKKLPAEPVGRFLNDKELDDACARMKLDRVPVLYRGPYSQEVVEKYTTGKETVSGKKKHVREGIVIRPQEERQHRKLGRVQLKSVSAKYLLRKGDTTEFN